MGFLNEGMDNSIFYAGEDSRHHRHISLFTNGVPRTSGHPNIRTDEEAGIGKNQLTRADSRDEAYVEQNSKRQ